MKFENGGPGGFGAADLGPSGGAPPVEPPAVLEAAGAAWDGRGGGSLGLPWVGGRRRA